MFSAIEEKIILVLACAVFLFLGVLYERHEGAVSCVASDVKAAVKQEVKVAADTAAAQVVVKQEGADYAQEKSKPITHAPVIRLCAPAQPSNSSPVLPASTPGPIPDAAPAERAEVKEVDTGPIIAVGRDADAQVEKLQDYIIKVCHAPT